jgi:hypothetical protein
MIDEFRKRTVAGAVRAEAERAPVGPPTLDEVRAQVEADLRVAARYVAKVIIGEIVPPPRPARPARRPAPPPQLFLPGLGPVVRSGPGPRGSR